MAHIDRSFPAQHPWDRNFILGLTLLGWLGILMGFGLDMQRHFARGEAAYLPIVHVHAAAFVGWMVLFTVQVLLVRGRRMQQHRQLGWALAGLALVMVVSGPITQFMVSAASYGKPNADPAFLAIATGALICFAVLVLAAILLRCDPSAHKRLLLLGTLNLTSAGFARWLGDWLGTLTASPFWGLFIVLFSCCDALILAIAVYDFVTRRRLQRAYVYGLLWVLAVQLFTVWLYFQPAWLAQCEAWLRPSV